MTIREAKFYGKINKKKLNVAPHSIIIKTGITEPVSRRCSVKMVFLETSQNSQEEIKYGEIRSISPYPVRLRENTDQKNSEYGHLLCSEGH